MVARDAQLDGVAPDVDDGPDLGPHNLNGLPAALETTARPPLLEDKEQGRRG